jgi:hypothetical protein
VLKCPQIYSTDLDDLRLLANFGEVGVAPCQRLSYTPAHDLSQGHQACSSSPPS